jgi:hypothetical protein
MEEALLAIIARINGEWDNPYLMGFGPFSVSGNLGDDIKFIAEQGIKGEVLIADCSGDLNGTSGQDRESYSDTQDRESYNAD